MGESKTGEASHRTGAKEKYKSLLTIRKFENSPLQKDWMVLLLVL